MVPEPGSPEDWLRHAKSDLTLARQAPGHGVIAETLCFHAQQAVEKSIKAVLIHRGIEFPKTHSIERLVGLLPAAIPRNPELLASAWLTVYASNARYPGIADVTEERLRQAVRSAEAAFAWAEAIVGGEDPPGQT